MLNLLDFGSEVGEFNARVKKTGSENNVEIRMET